MLTASDRAARSLQLGYHHRRRAEGREAWPAPAIHAWNSFTQSTWEERASDNRMVLAPIQEQSLWAEIIGREQHLATVLEGPRHRLAALAMQAHALLAAYAPRYLKLAARAGWDRDPGIFSAWLADFERLCHEQKLLSPGLVPLYLIELLRNQPRKNPAILIAGFDRLHPAQREFLESWGHWQELPEASSAQQLHYYAAADSASELTACTAWCRQHLAANPRCRLLVITNQIASRRGEIERSFLQLSTPGDVPLFEFSLGIPLIEVPLVHAASLVLRWLDSTLLEHELDWLLSTGLTTLDRKESLALQTYMRSLRRRGLARTDWSLEAFAAQSAVFEGTLGSWYRRITMARRKLENVRRRKLSPLEWAALVPQLLESVGIPGHRRLSSGEFQAWKRWEQVIDSCGSLGFDGHRISWAEFLHTLARTLEETLFTPESTDAPIQVAGPAESAGLTADGVWVLGADEASWPSIGISHPFLPLHVQRDAGMPHATMHGDWQLAEVMIARLMTSAPEVCFSYARQNQDAEAPPSRIVSLLAGAAQPIPSDLEPPPLPEPLAIPFNDPSRVSHLPEAAAVLGGAGVLTSQSQCPFKAFATARLGAQGWDAAEYGLSALQRGQLLHAVMHSIWSGPSEGVRSLSDLRAIDNKKSFVAQHVKRILRDRLPSGALGRLPQRYLDLEATRLTTVVCSWLEYEEQRLPFTVVETEAEQAINIGGLSLTLRLDRIDRLHDGSVIVIDYKTGSVGRKVWDLPRPEDVQLPLYTCFALKGEEPSGLLFAKVRAGEAKFVGYARTATTTLLPGLARTDPLIRQPLTEDQLWAWKESIQELASDFIAGRASVDPRDSPGTCERCDLHAVCRIHENQTDTSLEEEDAEDVQDE